MLWLKDFASIKTFVETGTFRAETTEWAAHNFDRVVSIEADESLFKAAQQRLKNARNVSIVFARSQDALREILAENKEPALLWLDAHWCGAGTACEEYECPVLEEISIADASPAQHFILIDDARLFLNPLPAPHNSDHWPRFPQLLSELRRTYPDSYIAILEDVVIRLPARAAEPFEKFLFDGY